MNEKRLLLFLLATLALVLTRSLYAQAVAAIHVEPPASILEIGNSSSVAIRIEDAGNVYGFQLQLSYDPGIIQVVDADESRPGVQVQSGDFLPEDQGFIVVNEADNAVGELHYAMTLLAPAEPASGNGSLVMIDLASVAEGNSELYINDVLLSSADGVSLPTTASHGQVVVGNGNPPPLVTPIPTSPPATSPVPPTPAEPVVTRTESPTSVVITQAPTTAGSATVQTVTASGATLTATLLPEMATTSSPIVQSTMAGTRSVLHTPANLQPQESNPPDSTPVVGATNNPVATRTAEPTPVDANGSTAGMAESIGSLEESTVIGSGTSLTPDESEGQDSDLVAVLSLLLILIVVIAAMVIWLRRRVQNA